MFKLLVDPAMQGKKKIHISLIYSITNILVYEHIKSHTLTFKGMDVHIALIVCVDPSNEIQM